MVKELIPIRKTELIITQMSNKYSKFKKLSFQDYNIFKDEKLIEIKIGNKAYQGKCFINNKKKAMNWRPQHQWYVEIEKLGEISYDLLQNKLKGDKNRNKQICKGIS